jgi:hypothetical protein
MMMNVDVTQTHQTPYPMKIIQARVKQRKIRNIDGLKLSNVHCFELYYYFVKRTKYFMLKIKFSPNYSLSNFSNIAIEI